MEKYTSLEKLVAMIPVGGMDRQGTVFETRNGKYFYDAGTGKVFGCEDNEYEVLKYLTLKDDEEASNYFKMSDDEFDLTVSKIIDLIAAEDILQSPTNINFEKNTKEELMKNVDTTLEHMVLELTEDCNLRCKYCIFSEKFNNFRTFTREKMNWEIARAALDYAKEHSDNKITIGFYGGEPLMNFPLMRKCIEYCQETFDENKEVLFTFTSNLTLMTKEIAEYLATVKQCKITCSLDGPKDIHNEFRVAHNDLGSFELTMRGLKTLIDALGKKAEDSISIYSVVSPPFAIEKFERMKYFFNQLTWLPSSTIFNMAYVDNSGLEDEDSNKEIFALKKEHYESNEMERTDPIMSWALGEVCASRMSQYEINIVREDLIGTHFRPLLKKPLALMARNGCCTPAQKRLYVTTSGEFHVCEKIGDSPAFGNVITGVDIDRLHKYYIEEYETLSKEECSNCWARYLCKVCYPSCYDEAGINVDKKKEACLNMRSRAKNRLIEYYQILEENPDYLYDMFSENE